MNQKAYIFKKKKKKRKVLLQNKCDTMNMYNKDVDMVDIIYII